jgi:hypothetical protein
LKSWPVSAAHAYMPMCGSPIGITASKSSSTKPGPGAGSAAP